MIPKSKRFLQDGCPVKNSKKASLALDIVGAIKFSIPPRSPDFNTIENIFNYVKSELRTQAFEKNIKRVKHTLENTNILIKLLNQWQEERWWLSSQKGKEWSLEIEIKSQIGSIKIYSRDDCLFGNTSIGSGTEYLINLSVFCLSFYIMLR